MSKLIMRYPTSWAGEMWREAAPFGNGKIGGLVYGGIWKENIMINHHGLWRGGKDIELPDVSDKLPEIRRLLDMHDPYSADRLLSDTLRERGYEGADFVLPTPLCDILIESEQNRNFAHYRRETDMNKALVTVSWDSGEAHYERRTFVSRANDTVFVSYTAANGKINAGISVDIHDTETARNEKLSAIAKCVKKINEKEYMIFFAADNVSVYNAGNYGAVAKVTTDGNAKIADNVLFVEDAGSIVISMRLFIATPYKKAFARLEGLLGRDFDFEEELKKHTRLHGKYFNKVKLSVSSKKSTSNEELLLDAYEKEASNEFIEKLYDYGRYLFICSTGGKDTLPCHLVGLFNGTYQCYWAFYMYNINFEMIYWQALSGNLPSFMRLALDYTESFMDDYRENAKKIFGCRGILINSVNTPESGIAKCLGNHIINWTGAAAWLSQHYWDYYRFTGDGLYLREHALPFMYETALFYEDFVSENENGYYDLYPSVSPENTPKNVLDKYGRSIETAKNATMEFALLKELLKNLLSGAKITGMYREKTDKWREMLSKIPPYKINGDGAIREWEDEYFLDNYSHRHQSQLYPVFPGNEVSRDNGLCKYFEKAIDLRFERGLTAQSSWSAVNMAGVMARLERGDDALNCLSLVTRSCLMNNFFTVHNDWRRSGVISCEDLRAAPFQIDANIGITGVINEMLLQSQNDELFILPALPAKWKKGSVSGLAARGGFICNIKWNEDGGRVTVFSKKRSVVNVRCKSGYCFEDGKDKKTVTVDGKTEILLRKM